MTTWLLIVTGDPADLPTCSHAYRVLGVYRSEQGAVQAALDAAADFDPAYDEYDYDWVEYADRVAYVRRDNPDVEWNVHEVAGR